MPIETHVHVPPQDATEEEIRAHSLAEEERTGADSVDTIERMYDRTYGGAIWCVFPDCEFARRDPIAMWRHVHFGPKHRSVRVRIQEVAERLHETTCGPDCGLAVRDGWLDMAEEVVAGRVTFDEAVKVMTFG